MCSFDLVVPGLLRPSSMVGRRELVGAGVGGLEVRGDRGDQFRAVAVGHVVFHDPHQARLGKVKVTTLARGGDQLLAAGIAELRADQHREERAVGQHPHQGQAQPRAIVLVNSLPHSLLQRGIVSAGCHVRGRVAGG